MATAPKARSNLQMENVDDDNHGQDRGSDRSEMDADAVIEELSAEEQAQLAGMRTGEADGGAEAGDEGDGGGDGDDEADADADGVDNDRDAAAAGDRDQGAGDDRGQREEGKRQPPKTINYGRHQREITKRDARLTELEALLGTERTARQTAEERSTRLDERTRMLLDAINTRPKADEQQQQQQQEDQDPEPDRDADPIGWNEWKVRGLERTVDELRTGVTRDREQREQETAEQREMRDFTSTIERAAQSNADFADAFVHLRESRFYELGDIYAGIDVNDPAECAKLSPADQAALSNKIQASFAQEQALVFRESKRTGRPIEQTIMRLAKARGFVPKQREQQRDDQQEQQQERRQERQQERRPPADTRREAPVRRPPPQRTVSEEIDNIREAAGASRSLSDAGGSPGGDIDLKRLVEMDDDEFADLYSATSKGKFDRLMGK